MRKSHDILPVARAVALVTACMLPLAACTGTPVTLDTPDHSALLQQDRQWQSTTAGAEKNQILKLTLDDALALAVKTNLDARVAAFEMLSQQKQVTLRELEALPSMSYTRAMKERSNDGASSSRSVLSGLQSLEPSQSSDRHRLVSETRASWDMMDAIVTLADADRMRDETKIMNERYSKVIHNIERDTYAAYWRAYAYQQTENQTNAALLSSQQQIAHLNLAVEKKLVSADKAADKIVEITGRTRALQQINDRLAQSATELKALLSLPQSTRLELSAPPQDSKRISALLKEDITDQEWIALKDRPEMREEVLQRNVAIKNVHHEILKTFPGGELAGSYNTDTNSFLEQHEWGEFSVSLVQNILNLITLPARYRAAEEKQKLADARRQALNAAIIAQVHLGRIRLINAERNLRDAKQASSAADKKLQVLRAKSGAGLASGQDVAITHLDRQIEILRRYAAQADLQDSYAAMVNTLGQNVTATGNPRDIKSNKDRDGKLASNNRGASS